MQIYFYSFTESKLVMRRLQVILFLIVITYVSISCSDKTPAKPVPAIDSPRITPEKKHKDSLICASYFDLLLPKNQFNGSILVARNGEIVYEKYVGKVRLKTGDTVSPSTPFHIASSSKPFTAISILKLSKEGKLKLSDSIQKYFPAFPYKGITIDLLLSQRSQLPDYIHFMNEYWKVKSKKASNNDVLDMMISHKPNLRGKPGKSFLYSNTNYLMLALIIEKVSGMSYPDYLKKNIFEPLMMNETFVFQPGDEKRITPSFSADGDNEPFTFLDQTYGDKNIYSTVRDMLKWDQALYTDFVSKDLLEKAFEITSIEQEGSNHYGRGWRLHLLDSTTKVIYHNGWWHGNNSCFYRVITESLTIIIQGNRMNKNIYKAKPLVELLTNLRFSSIETKE